MCSRLVGLFMNANLAAQRLSFGNRDYNTEPPRKPAMRPHSFRAYVMPLSRRRTFRVGILVFRDRAPLEGRTVELALGNEAQNQ